MRNYDLNSFIWDKNNRCYVSDYTSYSFQQAFTLVSKYFTSVELCSQSKQLLSKVDNYRDCTYWNPTLIKIKDSFYIAASNSFLMDEIKELELSDNPKTLFHLSQFGIDIDDSIITNELQTFASSHVYNTDNERIDQLISYFKALDIDNVVLENVAYKFAFVTELKNKLKEHKIKILSLEDLLENKNMVVFISFRSQSNRFSKLNKCSKFITIKNNTPVLIK
jgi:hypothetical protein